MKKVMVLVAASLTLSAAGPALADDAAAKYVREKAQLLERGFRDDDWAGMIEIGHDVLMRLPGEPTTLKWVGLALAQAGARRLALRALDESLRQKDDAEARRALAQLRQSFTQVRLEIVDVPNDPAVVDALMAMGSSLQAKGPERPLLPGLSEADKKRLAERVANIEKLGGVPAVKPTVERGMSSLTLSYKDVEVTAPTVKLHAGLEKYGFSDVDVELALKAGGQTFSSIRLQQLASLTVTGAGAADSLTLDGKPIAAAGTRVKPGAHVLARVRNGVSWPSDVTVAVGEKKTVALDEAWPEIDLDGWKSGDQLIVSGHAASAPDGKLFVPPGKLDFTWKRGRVEQALSATAQAGAPVHLPLPAVVHVAGDDSALSVELTTASGPLMLSSGAVEKVPAGPLAMTARLPRREPLQRSLTVAPGEDVTLDLPTRAFAKTAATALADEKSQHARKIGLALVGTGVALAVLAGGGAGLYAWQKSVGDDAYASYQSATTLNDLMLFRANVVDASTQQWVWGSVAIGLGAGAVACLGVGIWELTKRRAR